MDRDPLRRLTENYWAWQGLRWAPFGPALAWGGVTLLDQQWAEARWPIVVLLVLLAVALLTVAPLQRYYDRTFGVVQSLSGSHRRRDSVKWLAAYPLLLTVPIIEIWVRPAVSPTAATLAGLTLAFWWSTGRGRLHYVVGAASLALLVPLPVTGLVGAGRPMVGVTLIVVGTLYVVGGILDHRELRARLASIPLEPTASGNLAPR